MKVDIVRGVVQIEDARIIYRNFAGQGSKFNREGDRSFSMIIPDQECCDILVNEGFNVKIKPPREEDETPFMFLPIKVKFNNRGPNIYLRSGNNVKKLSEDEIFILDDIDILTVDMDIRAYDWEVNGKTGKTAYLQAMDVTQNIDRFGARYQAEELPF